MLQGGWVEWQAALERCAFELITRQILPGPSTLPLHSRCSYARPLSPPSLASTQARRGGPGRSAGWPRGSLHLAPVVSPRGHGPACHMPPSYCSYGTLCIITYPFNKGCGTVVNIHFIWSC